MSTGAAAPGPPAVASRRPGDVAVVAYEPRYAGAFRAVNEEWITRFFKLEPYDVELLGDPQAHILDVGGHIFVALDTAAPPSAADGDAGRECDDDARVLGVVSLIPLPSADYAPSPSFELAKMGVRPTAQGRGVGRLLGEATMRKARELGARSVHIWSNRRLGPALALYSSLGFAEVPMGAGVVFKRADIRLVCLLGVEVGEAR